MLAQLVALPIETQLGILGLCALVVTIVFNFIGTKAPWSIPFLEKWKEEISAALSGLVTGWLSVNLPGGAFESASIAGVNFVVALLVALLAYGTIHLFRVVKIKGFAG